MLLLLVFFFFFAEPNRRSAVRCDMQMMRANVVVPRSGIGHVYSRRRLRNDLRNKFTICRPTFGIQVGVRQVIYTRAIGIM